MSALTAGQSLQAAFDTLVTGQPRSIGEVKLFKHLITSLKGMTGVQAEEYHGSKFQVYHHTVSAVGLGRRRCELCDVLIVAVNPTYQLAPIRLTFLQAKYTRSSGGLVGPTYGYAADMVQWSLLSSQPPIAGAGTFTPPPDLLSGAFLPSVGSYGLFHPTAKGSFDLRFHVADALARVPSVGSGKRGRVQAGGGYHVRQLKGLPDLERAPSLTHFGAALAAMLVGTPVLTGQVGTDPLSTWLDDTLARLPASSSSRLIPLVRSVLRGSSVEGSSSVQVAGADQGGNTVHPTIVVVSTGFQPSDGLSALELLALLPQEELHQ